jgi:dipeptidyl-peptidase-4
MAAALFLTAAVTAAQPASAPGSLDDTLRQIFQKSAYKLRTFGPAHWLDGGSSYTTLEDSSGASPVEEEEDEAKSSELKPAQDIVAYDTATGRRQVLVPASKLVPPGASAPLEIDDYKWSKDRARLLVFTNTKKVWRRNTRGDYWILDVASGRLHKLGAEAPASSLMFATFSPDGSRAAYVRENNLYVEDLVSGAVTALTRDGSETTINGTSDWVSEEELDLRDAYRWSPDGKRIAYWQFDTTGVGVYTLIDDTDALYPTLKRFPYPKAGTTNSAVRVGVVSAAGGATQWLAVPGDPRNFYIPRMEWSSDSAIALEHLNRLQNENDLLLADLSAGKIATLFRDQARTWVDINGEILELEHGKGFLWESEKDGWRHVYRVSRDGAHVDLLTAFAGDVQHVEGVDEKGGWVYFSASPEKATERFLYRARLDGSGGIARITPADARGTHLYTLSPDARWAFHTFSRFDVPPAWDLIALPAHRTARVLLDNAGVQKKASALLANPAEFLRLSIGQGVTLDGWMIRPRSFDFTKKYPLVVYVYGEPAGQTVVDRWGGTRDLFHRALANEGYIVASFDNRGTPAPRGATWRKTVYGAVGDLTVKDQAGAVRALAAAHPYIDTTRVAIWGWSGGGSSTLNALFRHPDVYQVGVAVASVPDERLYDTIYEERYMGLPDKDGGGAYRAGSPIDHAEGLSGKLLIMHGSGDDNVHYQGAEKLVNRLVELGKPFDEVVYPNRTHSISEGAGTTLHVFATIARYIREHLPAGGR